jgi:[acyl-carrier-protein] S-malonyltransferase
MAARLLLWCPGQGGQHADMNLMAAADAKGAALLAAAPPLPEGSLFDNAVAQAAVVTATLAMWAALGPRLATLPLAPALVAGYSVGELSAWSVAGSIGALDAITLAQRRAALMNAAADSDQGLAAVGGLVVGKVAMLARDAGCALAIINDDDACVVGGPVDGLAALEHAVLACGGRWQRLPVTVAAHTPLLAASVAPFAAALAGVAFDAPRCAVLEGVSGTPLLSREGAIAALSGQLAQTIHWGDCMGTASEAGITVALELGPGNALARMMQARYPGIACRSVADFRSVEGVVGWLGRHC